MNDLTWNELDGILTDQAARGGDPVALGVALTAELEPQQGIAALRMLAIERMRQVISEDGLIGEHGDRVDKTAAAMATPLLRSIDEAGGNDDALERLIAAEITRRRRLS